MLAIKKPTPTTVLYTVSTRSPAATWTARASAYAIFLARIFAALCVAQVLLREYNITFPVSSESHAMLAALERVPFTSILGHFIVLLTAHTTRTWRLVICCAVLLAISRRSNTFESLLVIRGLGVQTSTSSPSYFWTSSTRFIPTSSIQDIFIYEAFKNFEVRYYLAIVVEGEGEVVVVFPVSLTDPVLWGD